jgi:hypothetical protein
MSKTTAKAQQHGWRSHAEFEQFLMDTLIPDLRESGQGCTANDFETALYYMRHRV